MSDTQEMSGLLRETWPKCNLHGQITTAQRLLVHTAADELERLERERNALLAALKNIQQLDPDVDSDEGYNEWGEADCFRKAQKIASDAVASIEGTNKTGEGK